MESVYNAIFSRKPRHEAPLQRWFSDSEIFKDPRATSTQNSSGYCSAKYLSTEGIHLNGAPSPTGWSPPPTIWSSDPDFFTHSRSISTQSSGHCSANDLSTEGMLFNGASTRSSLENFSATHSVNDYYDAFKRVFGKLENGSKLDIPLNVVLIDLKKVDDAIDKSDEKTFGKIKSNEERIDFVVRSTQSKYEEKTIEPTTNYTDFYCEDFKLKLYENGESGQTVLFLHRSEEIFALPVVDSDFFNWADKSFPFSVASAILDNKSVTEKEVKNLYENQYSTITRMRNGARLNETTDFHQRYATQFCTKFTGTASNAELNRILHKMENAEIKIRVQRESISFPNETGGLRECLEFCQLLAALNKTLDAPRSNEFDDNWNVVSEMSHKTRLNEELRSSLLRFLELTPSSKNEFMKFQIIVDDLTDYFKAVSFTVYHADEELQTYGQVPTIDDFHSLYDSNTMSVDDIEIAINSSNGEHKRKRKLFDCLEGILYDDTTKKNYGRVGGEWYEDSSKYHIEIFRHYHKIKREAVMSKEDSLLIEWSLNPKRQFPSKGEMTSKEFNDKMESYKQKRYVEERIYIQSCKIHNPSLVITDSFIKPHGIEICDIFEHIRNPSGQSKIRLYFVKKVFGADGYRSVICQMKASANLLFNDVRFREDANSSVYKLYQFVKDKLNGSDKFLDYKEFCDRLKNAVFVLCPLFKSGKRDLDDDNPLHTQYNFHDIANEIHPYYRDGLKHHLLSFLLNDKYIHPSGEFTTKWFETCAITNDKGFLLKRPVSDLRGEKFVFVDSFPGRDISNMEPRNLLKILKRKYYKKIDGLGTKELVVQLSHNLNFMEFDFKICQIEGVEDHLCP